MIQKMFNIFKITVYINLYNAGFIKEKCICSYTHRKTRRKYTKMLKMMNGVLATFNTCLRIILLNHFWTEHVPFYVGAPYCTRSLQFHNVAILPEDSCQENI